MLIKVLLSLGCPSCHSLMMTLGFFVFLYLRLVGELFIECNKDRFIYDFPNVISLNGIL